jgi:MFS family permease
MQSELERRTVGKVLWRIIPAIFTLYVISYIDRANIGYAALQMNQELALTSSAFGFAAGVFFIGYFLFEVPSNLALARFGARVWIARILITWGLVAAASAFVHTVLWLLGVRAVLALSFERIHRSNLIGMGILPLILPVEWTASRMSLAVGDVFQIDADSSRISPRADLSVSLRRRSGESVSFTAMAAIETALEVSILKDGGILPHILRRFSNEGRSA